MTLADPRSDTAPALPGRRRLDLNWPLLALLWLIHAISLVLWLRLDQRFPTGETASQLTTALRVADALSRPALDLLSRIAAASAGQPPLYYLASAPLTGLFGRGPDAATLVNLLWLALLIAGVFGITRRLFPGAAKSRSGKIDLQLHWPGLAAAALVTLYPAVTVALRVYGPALAAAGLAALAVWLLLASDGLQRRGYAIGFGLVLIAGLLTSSIFWAVVLGPLILAAAQALRTPRPGRGSRRGPSRHALERFGRRLRLAPAHLNLLGVLLLALVGLALSLPAQKLPTFGLAGNLSSALGLFASSPTALRVGELSLLLALSIGALYALWQVIRPRRADARPAFGLLLAWLGLGLILLALLGNGSASQWMPLLPAAAILSVAWLAPTELPARLNADVSRARVLSRLAAGAAALLLLVATITTVILTWTSAPSPQSPGPSPQSPAPSPQSPAPQAAKSQTAAIGQAVHRLCSDQQACRAVVLSCAPALSAASFDYFTTQTLLGDRLTFSRLASNVDFYYDLWDADFILSSSAGCSAADGLAEADLRRIGVAQEALDSAEFGQRFRPAQSFELPDGAQAQLWQRVGPPIAQMDIADQVSALEHILAVSPTASAANLTLSALLEQIGDPIRALAMREEIIDRSPEDSAARLALGDLYLAYGRPQDAVEQYQAALADDASAPTEELLLRLAAAYQALGQWDDAEAALLAASEQAPDDYTVRLRQGQFYLARGRFAEATAALAQARQIDPARFESYIALGQAQLLRNDLAQAEAEGFRRAQEAAPASPEPLLAWADALAARGELNQASQRYSQAVELANAGSDDEAVIAAYSRWIASLETLGASEQATTLAETLARTYPRSASAQATLAGLASRQGRAEQASAAWQASLELAPHAVATRVGLAQALASQGRFDEADQILQEGLALPAGQAELLTAAGDLLAAQGDQGPSASQTIERYQQALQANPAYWPAAASLAQFFLSRGQANQAWQTVDAAMQQWPEVYQLHALAGDALRQMGRRQEALTAYRQAIELAPASLFSADPINATLARLYTRQGEAQLEGRAFDPAQESFEQALRLAADQVDAHIGLARLNTILAQRASGAAVGSTPGQEAAPVATDQVRFRQASDAIQAALALQPDSIAALTAQGDLYAAYGRTSEAIEVYQQALTLDPDLAAEARADLFTLYLAQNRTDEVIAFYRQLLREKPDNVAALRGLADANIAAGQTEAALDAFDLFLARADNRDNVAALMAQGETLRQLGLLDQALTPFTRAARLSGPTGSMQPQVEVARTLTALGRTDEAEAAWRALLRLLQDPATAAELTGDPTQVTIGLARLLLSENRIDEAEAIVAAALAAQPNAATVQILAGDLSRFQGRRAEALAAFRRAAELAPSNVVANTRVGDLLLEGGQTAEAQAAYEAALASDPSDRSALLGLARVLSRSVGATPAGGVLAPEQTALVNRAQQLVDAVLLSADDPSTDAAQAAQIIRADLLATQGLLSEATDAYQAVLLQDPDHATAIEGLARMLLAAGEADQAIARYQAAADAAETDDGRNRWLMTLAATYRSLDRLDDAEQIYRGMIEANPANSAAHQALGDLFQAANRLDEATAQYRLAVEAAPDDVDLVFRLGRTLLQTSQVEEAAQMAASLLAASPSAWQSYLLAGRVAQTQGDPTAALASLRQAQSLAPTNSAALTLIGDTFLAASRVDDAASAYSAASALQPNNVSALVGLSRVYTARGRVADAEASLRRALAIAPNNLAVQAALGRLLLRVGRPAEAIPLLEAAIAQRADHPSAVRDLADAYLASDRIEEGLAIYRANLSLEEASQGLVIGQALLNAGRIEAGLAELQDYVTAHADDPAGWLALAQGQQLVGDAAALEQADASLQRAIETAPDDLTLRIRYGDFLLGQQASSAAAASFQAVIDALEQDDRLDEVRQPVAADADAATPVELWRAWIGLARAQQQMGEYDQALAAAEAGAALRPDVAAFSLQIGDILAAAGRSQEALAAYERAASFGNSTTPLNRAGNLYLRLGQADQALATFEAALALASDDADALLGLAGAYALRGAGVDQADFANAEARLKRAAQLLPGNAAVSLALGDLYMAYSRYEEAVAHYRGALATLATPTAAAQERLASALRAAGQLQEALQEQLKLLELLPDDRGARLGLAIIYRALGQPEDAEATYRQLLERTPDDPVTLIALGDLMLEQGQVAEAVAIYQQALTHAADPSVASQASDQLGKAYLRLGEIELARSVADGLVADQPTLERGYLLLGSVFEAQNDSEAALAAYQQGVSQVTTPLALQLRLGELYLRLGRPAEAQELFDSLTKSYPRSEDAFVGLARAHIDQLPDLQSLRTDWANQALRAALRLNPRSIAALTAQGDLLIALQRPAEAAAAYQTALVSRTAGSGDDTALRLKLANALAAAGQWQPALQEFQRLAVVNPDNVGIQMSLGHAFRGSGRGQQALAQYRHVNQLAPDYPHAYIRQGEVLDELGQRDQALAAYRAAVAAAPNNADAAFTLAVAYRQREMTPEAIAAFEAGLAIDPTRAAARTALEELRATGQ
jgi:tetratricopeptide (TPR) repeat protein